MSEGGEKKAAEVEAVLGGDLGPLHEACIELVAAIEGLQRSAEAGPVVQEVAQELFHEAFADVLSLSLLEYERVQLAFGNATGLESLCTLIRAKAREFPPLAEVPR